MYWTFAVIFLVIISSRTCYGSDSSSDELHTAMSWYDALEFCSSQNLNLSIDGQNADKQIWTGKYRARTPWAQLIGCFKISLLPIARQEVLISNNGVTSCFHACYKANESNSQLYLALQDNRCTCIGEDPSSLAKELPPLECSNDCPGDNNLLCGGNSSLYSVYRTDLAKPFENGKGFCSQIDKDGIKPVGCNSKPKKEILCEKAGIQSGGGRYLNISRSVKGKEVIRECHNIDARVPYKDEQLIIRFIKKLKKQTEAVFWFGNRIFSQSLVPHDIKPIKGYVLMCVGMTNSGKETLISCEKKLPFYCSPVSPTAPDGAVSSVHVALVTVSLVAVVLAVIVFLRCKVRRKKPRPKESQGQLIVNDGYVGRPTSCEEEESPYDVILDENKFTNDNYDEGNYDLCGPTPAGSIDGMDDSFDSCFDKSFDDTDERVSLNHDNNSTSAAYHITQNHHILQNHDPESSHTNRKRLVINDDKEKSNFPDTARAYHVLEVQSPRLSSDQVEKKIKVEDTQQTDFDDYSHCVMNTEDDYNHLDFKY